MDSPIHFQVRKDNSLNLRSYPASLRNYLSYDLSQLYHSLALSKFIKVDHFVLVYFLGNFSSELVHGIQSIRVLQSKTCQSSHSVRSYDSQSQTILVMSVEVVFRKPLILQQWITLHIYLKQNIRYYSKGQQRNNSIRSLHLSMSIIQLRQQCTLHLSSNQHHILRQSPILCCRARNLSLVLIHNLA